jgi:hypothetical protein
MFLFRRNMQNSDGKAVRFALFRTSRSKFDEEKWNLGYGARITVILIKTTHIVYSKLNIVQQISLLDTERMCCI